MSYGVANLSNLSTTLTRATHIKFSNQITVKLKADRTDHGISQSDDHILTLFSIMHYVIGWLRILN